MTETPEPPFGAMPKSLSGKELPSFRYALGDAPAKQFDGGTAKEANGMPTRQSGPI
jgi:oxalate decarboxylase